jgi:hypothetical protein
MNSTRIKHAVRFRYMISYVMLTLEECLITLNLVLNND